MEAVMRAVTFLLPLALAGCAYAPQWQKDGATQDESREDAKLCEYESLKVVEKEDRHLRATHGQELDKSCRRRDLTIACMRSKGYEVVKNNTSRTGHCAQLPEASSK
jgi:hypothetical protein